MKTTNKRKTLGKTNEVRAERWKIPPKVIQGIAFTMIGIAVAASYFLTPLPVAIGMTVLALVRLWIVRREERKQLEEATLNPMESVCNAH